MVVSEEAGAPLSPHSLSDYLLGGVYVYVIECSSWQAKGDDDDDDDDLALLVEAHTLE